MNSTEKSEYTLLHVEDSPELQELVRHILTSRPGIKIISAETVAEGVQQAKKHHPDMVLMDVHLPDGSGMDALKQMQASKETANIRSVQHDHAIADRGRIERRIQVLHHQTHRRAGIPGNHRPHPRWCG